MCKRKLLVAMFGACISLGLVACGSDSDNSSSDGLSGLETSSGGTTTSGSGTGTTTNESGTGSTTTGSVVNDARTIALQFDDGVDAVSNLGAGVYRIRGRVSVSDDEGNAVPDGTKVYLNLVDSIIAKGTITTADGDSISGSVLTDTNPTLADATATTLDTAYVVRNGAHRFIRGGDHLYLKGDNSNGSNDSNSSGNADPEDKNRLVSSDDGAITANTLTVEQAYVNDYPNAVYTTGVTDYVVGASQLGARVVGIDGETDEPTNVGYTETVNGDAEFFVIYPATVREINSGCIPADVDERSLPLGSADVMLVASAGTEAVTIDDRFCFEPDKPFAVFHEPDHIVGVGAVGVRSSEVVVEDDNGVPIPFEPVRVYAAGDGGLVLSAALSSSRTDRWGKVDVNITYDATAAASGDSGTVSVRVEEGSDAAQTDVSVTVN